MASEVYLGMISVFGRLIILEYLFKLCEEKHDIVAWPLLLVVKPGD